MRTAIIAAMEEEVKYLRKHINHYEMYEFHGYQYHIGDIEGQNIVLVQSGIGKVNAALATTLLLEHFSVEAVVNTGSAGGLATQLNVGDIIIGKELVYHDVDVTDFGYAYGQVPNMPARFSSDKALVRTFSHIMKKLTFHYSVGIVATGDTFITDVEQVRNVRELFADVQAVEMEAAAIAQVCVQYQIPVIVVRSISDVIGKNSSVLFEQYVATAAQNVSSVIVEFLKQKTDKQG